MGVLAQREIRGASILFRNWLSLAENVEKNILKHTPSNKRPPSRSQNEIIIQINTVFTLFSFHEFLMSLRIDILNFVICLHSDSTKCSRTCCTNAIFFPVYLNRPGGGGGGVAGTLYIFWWGCATGTLKPLPYTRPVILQPYTRHRKSLPYPRQTLQTDETDIFYWRLSS